MSIGDRVQDRIDAKGISQAELARRIGVSQHSVWHLINKSKTGSRHIAKIARELGTSVAYLEGEIDDPEEGAQLPALQREDTIQVAMIDLAYGMGGSYLAEAPQVRVEEFPLSFIRHFTSANPENLVVAEGVGDSMAPTIGPSDLVLIDRGQDNLNINDRIWACAVGEIGMIKRLRPKGDRVTILSDNPNVPDDDAADGELHVIGRVVGKFSRL